MCENAPRSFFNGRRTPYSLRKLTILEGGRNRSKLEPEDSGSIQVK